MIKKFKTLFFVKSSLISLYLAFTLPIPFISIEELKLISIIVFVLVPQRVENLDEFLSLILERTGLDTDGMYYISPLWTYKLLTFLSLFMIIGEIISFSA